MDASPEAANDDRRKMRQNSEHDALYVSHEECVIRSDNAVCSITSTRTDYIERGTARASGPAQVFRAYLL